MNVTSVWGAMTNIALLAPSMAGKANPAMDPQHRATNMCIERLINYLYT